MEAVKMLNQEVIKDVNKMSIEELAHEIDHIRKVEGVTFVEIGKQVGYSREAISSFVNSLKTGKDLENSIRNFLMEYYGQAPENPIEYKKEIEMFATLEFKKTLGFLEDMRQRRKMGCIIGYPGSGKTTVIKEYTKAVPEAVYIEAFESMRLNDLLELIAEKLGIALKKGSSYKKTQQIIEEYDGRNIILIIDEAEYLKKWDVSKFDVLRKIWDNTGIPIIFCGTNILEEYLTHGGNGRENLSQLYRRIYKMRLDGIKESEVREILKSYNVDSYAENLLIALAIDVKHGGMGNFVEVLESCLQQCGETQITADIVRNAKNYKMLY